MWNYLIRINKNLTIAIPCLMAVGFIAGVLVDQEYVKTLRYLIVPLTFLMVYPMMVTLNIKHLAQGLNVKLQTMTQLINFGIIPFIAYLLGLLFFPDQPYMALGLLLASLLPTSGMTISWTGFANGNLAAAVKMTVFGLILGLAALYRPLTNLSYALDHSIWGEVARGYHLGNVALYAIVVLLVTTIVLASVAIYELFGPISTRWALMRSGEAKLYQPEELVI